MISVAHHSPDYLIGHPSLAKYGFSRLRMAFEGGMDLPIEVVQQTGDSPLFHILSIFHSIEAHGGFHRKHVLDEVVVFDIFTDKGKGFFAGHGLLNASR
jgi:hypothetical protein